MAFIPRNDEQIKVGTTPGLVAGQSSFTFDGSTVGLPDYRGYEIVISELGGRGIMVRDLDYSWDYVTGLFNLLQGLGIYSDEFQINTYYNVHFENPITFPIPILTDLLTDVSYFIRDIKIPNIDPLKTTNASSVEDLNLFIQKYEPQCLRLILGFKLYDILLNESSQRVTDLIFGADYTDSQEDENNWQGLVRQAEKISLIANYIYFYFQQSKAAHTTGVGTSIAKPEAGQAFSPADKMAQAWNFFSSEVESMCSFLWMKKNNGERVYPEFTQNQFFETRRISRKIDSVFSF